MTSIKGIVDVFDEAQNGMQSHPKLIKHLEKIYLKIGLEKFKKDFIYLLQYSMIIMKREPAVERVLDFAAKFSTAVTEREGEENRCEDELSTFLLTMFEYFLENHGANSQAVRFRCCQMINKLFNNMSDDAAIDEDLCDRIYDCMQTRLRDKFPAVRVQAVLALSRLQDPSNSDCPVIKAYLFLIGCDPNPDVRRAVLQVIIPSTKTLPAILERTRDVRENVRRVSYQIIAEKIHIRALSIAQRVKVVESGLNDRAAVVREACTGKLLQAWLRMFEGDTLELLKSLDVENSIEACEKVLNSLFKASHLSDIFASLDLLDENVLLPMEKLGEESVFYWRILAAYVHKMGSEASEYMDKLLPTASVLADYILRVQKDMEAEVNLDKQLTNEFILLQLVQLTHHLDLDEEVGRKRMNELVETLLQREQVTQSMVKPIMVLLSKLIRDPALRVKHVIEIISEVTSPTHVVEKELAADLQRKLDLKVAGLKVELNELREELDQALQKEDYTRAAELKEGVKIMDARKKEILDQAKPQTQELREERNDPDTIVKCLTIVYELLQDVSIRSLTPALQTLIEVLVLPAVQSKDPVVRLAAVRTLGCCCLLSKELSVKHIVLFITISQIDQETVAVTSLSVLFDQLMIYGFGAFTESEDKTFKEEEEHSTSKDSVDLFEEEEDDEEMTPEQSRAVVVAGLVNILTRMLDSESSEIRTVVAEGLSKLLLSGRLLSPKLFTRLVLLWYSPITEDDVKLRHCLGTFFPMSNQDIVAEAFLPTLQALFDAPGSSPLADINVENVADFLVNLTNHRLLLNKQQIKDGGCHDELALKISNEVLSDPNSYSTRTLCKVLSSLTLSKSNEGQMKELMVLALKMKKVVKDKPTLRVIEKHCKLLKEMCPNIVIDDEDKEQHPPPVETTKNDTTALTSKMSRCHFPSESDTDTDSNATMNMTKSRILLPKTTAVLGLDHDETFRAPNKFAFDSRNSLAEITASPKMSSTRLSARSSTSSEAGKRGGYSAFPFDTPIAASVTLSDEPNKKKSAKPKQTGRSKTTRTKKPVVIIDSAEEEEQPTRGRRTSTKSSSRNKSRSPLEDIRNEVR